MGNSNFNGIDSNLATTLVSNYANNHLNAINSDPILTSLRQDGSNSDSRSVWFSLDTINSFINAIQNSAAENCTAINGALGIRIYFGEYPGADSELWGTDALPAGSPLFLDRYAGMHTLLMVPTYNNGQVDMDFDPNFANPDGSPIMLPEVYNILDIEQQMNSQQPGPGGSPSPTVTMLNHGGLIPPPYYAAGQYGQDSGASLLDVADL